MTTPLLQENSLCGCEERAQLRSGSGLVPLHGIGLSKAPQQQHPTARHRHRTRAPGVEKSQLHTLNRISSKTTSQICKESRSDPSWSPARPCPVSPHPLSPRRRQPRLRPRPDGAVRAGARGFRFCHSCSFPPLQAIPACPNTLSRHCRSRGGGQRRFPLAGIWAGCRAREFSHSVPATGSDDARDHFHFISTRQGHSHLCACNTGPDKMAGFFSFLSHRQPGGGGTGHPPQPLGSPHQLRAGSGDR